MFYRLFKFPAALLLFLLSACTALGSTPSLTTAPSAAPTEEFPGVALEPHEDALEFDFLANRSPDVPDLPFPDNPDPSQCGIPQLWGDDTSAYLTGYYGGELIQPIVLLYDSHLRLKYRGRSAARQRSKDHSIPAKSRY